MIRLLLLIVLTAASASGEPIVLTLRSTARVMPGQDVRIGDVAVIKGPTPEQIADAIVIDAEHIEARIRRGWLSVSAIEVMEAAGLGRAEMLLRGSTCSVRVLKPASEAVGADGRSGTLAQGGHAAGPVVLDHVKDRLCQEFGVDAADLRVRFEERYAETLHASTLGCLVEVHPTGRSREMPISVTLYRDESIVLSETVRMEVEIRRSVAVVDRLIERRAMIGPDQYHFEDRWVPATESPATESQIEGATARTTLKPGKVIRMQDVESPIVVRRGDLVAVRVISGSIVARITARALADGRDGERVQFEPINGTSRFYATMNGPGRAVLTTTLDRSKER